MTVRALILPVVIILLFTLLQLYIHPPPTGMERNAKDTRPLSELIIGNWQLVNTRITGWIRHEFTPDGKLIRRSWSPRLGLEEESGWYRLEGNIIRCPGDGIKFGPGTGIIREMTFSIESIDDEQMVELIIVKKMYEQWYAENMALLKNVPVGEILNQVEDETRRHIWIRVRCN